MKSLLNFLLLAVLVFWIMTQVGMNPSVPMADEAVETESHLTARLPVSNYAGLYEWNSSWDLWPKGHSVWEEGL